jgi:hypothetical protein
MRRILGCCVRLVAVSLMIGGLLFSSACAVAELVPLQAAEPPASAQTPAAGANSNGAMNQPAPPHRSKSAKTKIAVGFVLLGVGALTLGTTAALGIKPGGAKTPALYAAGAGAAGVGITLIYFGFHRRRPQ